MGAFGFLRSQIATSKIDRDLDLAQGTHCWSFWPWALGLWLISPGFWPAPIRPISRMVDNCSKTGRDGAGLLPLQSNINLLGSHGTEGVGSHRPADVPAARGRPAGHLFYAE